MGHTLRAATLAAAALLLASPMRGASDPLPETARPASDVIREASAVAVLGGGRLIVIAVDEDEYPLFGMLPEAPDRAFPLALPDDAGPLDDLESLVSLSDTELLAVTSHSRNKKGEAKPKRSRAAVITLDADLRSIRSVRLLPPLREAILLGLSAGPGGVSGDEVADAKPDEGGLNVEGAALWQGKVVLGLREPVASGGGAFLLDFGDLASLESATAPKGVRRVFPARAAEGIRDLTVIGTDLLLLLGGVRDQDQIPRRLVRWNGSDTPVVLARPGPAELENAEGIALLPDGRFVVAYDVAEGTPVRIIAP